MLNLPVDCCWFHPLKARIDSSTYPTLSRERWHECALWMESCPVFTIHILVVLLVDRVRFPLKGVIRQG